MSNTPPNGHGVYARAQTIDWLARFDFVLVNADASNAQTIASGLKAVGKKVYLYALPSTWAPGTDYGATISRFERLIDSTQAEGAVADTENGWPQASSREVAKLHEMLKASVERGYSWGFSTYPELLTKFAAFADIGMWVTPQVYGQPSAHSDAYWMNKAKTLFGADKAIPSVALWPYTVAFRTIREYRDYLLSLPPAPAAIGWTIDQTPGTMIDAYLSWHPWANKAYNPPPGVFWPWVAGAASLAIGAWLWKRKKR